MAIVSATSISLVRGSRSVWLTTMTILSRVDMIRGDIISLTTLITFSRILGGSSIGNIRTNIVTDLGIEK